MSQFLSSDRQAPSYADGLTALNTQELPIHLLLVEDSRVDALFIRTLLEKTESDLFLTTWVDSLEGAVTAIQKGNIDVVLLDVRLQDSDEESTFVAITEHASELPIVVLTGHDDIEYGFEAIRNGAQDYLIKGQATGEMLVRSLVYAMERKRIELHERRQAELSLQESEGKYRMLFEYESDALVVLDVASKQFEDANRAAVELFGYSRDEFRFLPAEMISAEVDKTREHLTQVRQAEGEDSYRIPFRQFRKKDGSVFAGETAVRTFVNGGRKKMIASIRDITERQLMEEALRKSEARFRLLVEHAADAFFLHDLEGRILDVNQQACGSLGYERYELLSMSILSFDSTLQKEDLERLWLGCEVGMPLTRESVHTRRDATSFPVELRMGRMPNEERPLLLTLVRDITQRKQDEARRLFDAYHDQLTRLPNRTLFLKELEAASANLSDGEQFAVLFVDLDRFKKINDSLGHEAGDQLIIEAAQRIKKLLGTRDVLARLSADEFAVLFRFGESEEANRLVWDIHAAMRKPFVLRKHEAFCSVSMGIALSEMGYEEVRDLLRDAEIALHQAKEAGRSKAVFFDRAMRDKAIALHQMETELRRALEREEFVVYYQPIISLEKGVIIGFEALVRWQHPERGLLSPGTFLPVAEEFGILGPMGWQVLWEACRQVKAWNETFAAPVYVGVNVASVQFERAELLHQVKQVLFETGCSPSALKLEMTETTLMDESEVVDDVVQQLTELGIAFAMDDFGTGYSSLSYLHRFPVQTLKIDRSFVSRMQPGDRNTEIVQTIVALASALGVDVIAEGVENPQQLTWLRELGCQFAQGYLISPPVEASVAETLLSMQPRW
jgi:diguanylate cyclase (GGDEF)-like protein/PAS domain S-box-containing protein